MSDGELYQMFLTGSGRTRPVHKWHHYFAIYERFFAPFRGRPVQLLEIGVQRGGSMQMWRSYFGPSARIVAYLQGGGSITGFKQYLAKHRDAVFELTAGRSTHLDTFVEVTGDKVRLTVKPEQERC